MNPEQAPESVQKEAQKKGIARTAIDAVWGFMKDCGSALIAGTKEAFYLVTTMFGAAFGQMMGYLAALMLVMGVAAIV